MPPKIEGFYSFAYYTMMF